MNCAGGGGEGRLQLFERELSVTQQDIFYRKLRNDESPLGTQSFTSLMTDLRQDILTEFLHSAAGALLWNISLKELLR